MSDKAGVRINGTFYPYVEQFKHGDPILIYEVTGLDWDTFSEMLAKGGDGLDRAPNPIVLTALMAVAVQRVHTTLSRREVSEYIRNLDLGGEEYVGAPQQESAVVLPPSESGENSSNSDVTSPPSPDAESSPNPTGSGDHGSEQPSPVLRQVG